MFELRDLTEEQQKEAKRRGYMGVFAHRETVQEAYEYALAVVNSVNAEDRAAVVTAIQVLVNTYALTRAMGDYRREPVNLPEDSTA